ncbi:Protein kinase dsk1 [Hypsizygus marmoreus]|uniref:non-specific serine/threonine protein kinase n=1 Tax=Hypsizygus marmoreus TaxID=39966 RepID=A0A369J7E2_HYPMA|nr:Protein kinase dsk1 [Hypsizygus marmoreus]
MAASRFRPSPWDDIEYFEDYRLGGFHPVAIGDVFAQRRYRVVHKLGFGSSSTIWLARDQPGKRVALRVMHAEVSSKPAEEIEIWAFIPADHFTENGPNGSHLCLVYGLAGPSILSTPSSPGRVSTSRRLRKDLARNVAKQLACAFKLMHTAGFVMEVRGNFCGGGATFNILFRVAENVQEWSDSEVYLNFGQPETEKVVTRDGSPPGPHAPAQLIAPIENVRLTYSTLLPEDILLIDFGQSFSSFRPR